MKHLILILSFFVFSNQALSKQVPTGNHLVRLICQKYVDMKNDGNIEYFNHVFILEQISTKPLNVNTALSDTIDGSVLIDPDNKIPTDEAAFRLRIYKASLRSNDKTEEEIIEKLLSSEADLDGANRPMDHMGIGYQLSNHLMFRAETPYGFLKDVLISMKDDFSGFMETNLGGSNPLEDGLYMCKAPLLIPETVGEKNNL